MNEFDLIARYFAPLAAHPAALGLKDDAALLDLPEGQSLVITKDAISAGVHFIGDEPASLTARKLLRVNLSDLAAMGAAPLGYLLALALPKNTEEAWVKEFAEGLAEDQDRFGISLLGGDTISTSGPLTLSLTALGSAPRCQALRRAGARAGDAIFVSGTLGDGALGLDVLQGLYPFLCTAHQEALIGRYRLPQPRLDLGRALRGLATAAMDVSDGLVQDLGHLCAASGVGAVIEAAALPLSEAARAVVNAAPEAISRCLTGGDDYELLFTLPAAQVGFAEKIGVEVTRIGEIVAGNTVSVKDANGQSVALQKGGFRHF